MSELVNATYVGLQNFKRKYGTTISSLCWIILLNGIIQVHECLNFSGNAVDNSW